MPEVMALIALAIRLGLPNPTTSPMESGRPFEQALSLTSVSSRVAADGERKTVSNASQRFTGPPFGIYSSPH